MTRTGSIPTSRGHNAVNPVHQRLQQRVTAKAVDTEWGPANPEPVRKEQVDVDFLDEDPIISNQIFALMSYVLPDPNKSKNGLSIPMVKFRGAYKDMESASKRGKYLQSIDPEFHIYTCEVGKWLGLWTEDELAKNDEIDIIYRETQLNTLMKDYKDNRGKAKEEFEQRKNEMKERAVKEGTKDGQIELSKKREEPIALLQRIENYKEHIQELQDKIAETQKALAEAERKKENEYSPSEFESLEDKLVNMSMDEEIVRVKTEEVKTEDDCKGKEIKTEEGVSDAESDENTFKLEI